MLDQHVVGLGSAIEMVYTSRQDATFGRMHVFFTAPYFDSDEAMTKWSVALEDSVKREFASKAFTAAVLPALPVLPASIQANDSASNLVRPGAQVEAAAAAAREEWMACLRSQAVRLDDRRTPANEVGSALYFNCREQELKGVTANDPAGASAGDVQLGDQRAVRGRAPPGGRLGRGHQHRAGTPRLARAGARGLAGGQGVQGRQALRRTAAARNVLRFRRTRSVQRAARRRLARDARQAQAEQRDRCGLGHRHGQAGDGRHQVADVVPAGDQRVRGVDDAAVDGRRLQQHVQPDGLARRQASP